MKGLWKYGPSVQWSQEEQGHRAFLSLNIIYIVYMTAVSPFQIHYIDAHTEVLALMESFIFHQASDSFYLW